MRTRPSSHEARILAWGAADTRASGRPRNPLATRLRNAPGAPCAPCPRSSRSRTRGHGRYDDAGESSLAPDADPPASSLFHLQAKGHGVDHAANRGRIVMLHHLPDVSEPKRLHGGLLLRGEPDDALDQGHSKFACHLPPPDHRRPPPGAGSRTQPAAASCAETRPWWP